MKGADLIGRPYQGPFDELAAQTRCRPPRHRLGRRQRRRRNRHRPHRPRRGKEDFALSKATRSRRHRADRRVRRLRRWLRLADGPVRPRGRRRHCRKPRAERAALSRRAVPPPLPGLLALRHRPRLPAGRRVVHRHGRAAPADDGRHPPDQLGAKLRPGARARLAGAHGRLDDLQEALLGSGAADL